MSKTCAICNGNTTFLTRRKIADDKVVCTQCFDKAKTLTNKQIVRLKNVTADEIKQSIKDSVGEEVMNFKPTKEIGRSIKFDDMNKQILIPGPFSIDDVLDYNDIVSYELLEDGETITSGGLGRAAVGGVLFGGAGAVVGAVTGKKNKGICNSMRIKLTVDNIDNPVHYVSFTNEKIKRDSEAYLVASNEAQECLSVLQLICDR